MTTKDEAPPSSWKRKLAKRLLLFLLALELLYAGGLSWWMNTPHFARVLSTHPEKFHLQLDKGWTVIPLVVHLRGAEMGGGSSRTQWQAKVDRGVVSLALLPLLRREFIAQSARAAGIEYSQVRRDPEGPTRPPAKWSFQFNDLRLREVRRIHFYQWIFEGDADATINLEKPTPMLQMKPSTILFREGRLERGGSEVSSSFQGRLYLESDPYPPRENRGVEALEFWTFSGDFSAPESRVGFLHDLFRKEESLVEFTGDAGAIEAHFELRSGTFAPGSQLVVDSEEITLHFKDYRAGGRINLTLAVAPKNESEAQLSVVLDEFSLRREGFSKAYLHGERLRLESSLEIPAYEHFSSAFESTLRSLRGEISIPKAQVDDLRYYNTFLPRKIGLDILSGRADVETEVSLTSERGIEGDLRISSDKNQFSFRDLRMTTGLRLETHIRQEEGLGGPMDLSGTRLDLKGLQLSGTKDEPADRGWWASAKVREGVLRQEKEDFLKAKIDLAFRDLRPLVRLVLPSGSLPDWLNPILELKKIRGTGDLVLGRKRVLARSLSLDAGPLHLGGDLFMDGNKSPEERWELRLHDLQVRDLDSLELFGVGFSGQADLRGGVHLKPGTVQITPTTLDLRRGRFIFQDKVFAREVNGSIELESESFDPGAHKDRKGLGLFDVAVNLTARTDDLTVLSPFLARVRPWVELRRGAGAMSAFLYLEKGRLHEDSELNLATQDLILRFKGYETESLADLRFTVGKDPGDSALGELEILLKEVALKRIGFGDAHVQAPEARVRISLDLPPLDERFPSIRDEIPSIRAAISIPEAKVADLRFYNAYLPKGSGLKIKSGTGIASTEVQLSPEKGFEGALALVTEEASFAFADFDVAGRLEVNTQLRQSDLKQRSFDIAGTEMALNRLFVRAEDGEEGAGEEDPWWASVRVISGCIRPGKDESLSAEVDLDAKSIRPLLRLWVASKDWPEWVGKVLRLEGVKGTGSLTVGRDFYRLSHLDVRAGKVRLQGDVSVSKGLRDGALLFTWRKLGLGVRLSPTEEKADFAPGGKKFRREMEARYANVPQARCE